MTGRSLKICLHRSPFEGGKPHSTSCLDHFIRSSTHPLQLQNPIAALALALNLFAFGQDSLVIEGKFDAFTTDEMGNVYVLHGDVLELFNAPVQHGLCVLLLVAHGLLELPRSSRGAGQHPQCARQCDQFAARWISASGVGMHERAEQLLVVRQPRTRPGAR